ncbi:MAG: class I tRNA ligase family protein, partial [Acidobacteriota bacterium]|nr:class I tRNA ligase family protein [Acidobacteriota bacterium]
YTAAPKSSARRSAQTALYRIADALARLVAPILVFTADEIWENLPRASNDKRAASVHLAEFPPSTKAPDDLSFDLDGLQGRWLRLFLIRDVVLRALEESRVSKIIGGSLEAHVKLEAAGAAYELLERYRNELRYIFIVSQVSLEKLDESKVLATEPVRVRVERAEGEKCERCWSYSTRVGESERYPTACERCVPVLAELERGEAA